MRGSQKSYAYRKSPSTAPRRRKGCTSWQRVEVDRRSDRLPAGMADLHVARIEAGLAKRDRCAASDVEAVSTVDHHRRFLGQFSHPLGDSLGVAPADPL